MSEGALLRQIQLEVTRCRGRAFRNNVGFGYTRDGNPVKFGLCPGSSDLIGWTPITIEASHVGRRFAIFTALEVKTLTGRASVAQRRFLAAVAEAGGISAIVKDPASIRPLLDEL